MDATDATLADTTAAAAFTPTSQFIVLLYVHQDVGHHLPMEVIGIILSYYRSRAWRCFRPTSCTHRCGGKLPGPARC